MAGWLDRFGGKGRGKKEGASPADVPYVPPAFSFDDRILMHSWVRTEDDHHGGENHVHEQVFLNPDPDSPVAALMVSVMDEEPVLALEAIPRTGKENEACKILYATGATDDTTYYDMSPQTCEKLQAAGIGAANGKAITLLAAAAYNKLTLVQTGMTGRRILEALDHTEALSKHPQVRDAMVAALCQHFVTFNVAKDFDQPKRSK